MGIQDDSPRLSFTGPIVKDKLTFSQYAVYDINNQPVRGLAWPNNEIKQRGFESFSDLYYVVPSKSCDCQLEGLSLAQAIRKHRFFHTTDGVFRLRAERIFCRRHGPVHVFERWSADHSFPVHRL